MKHATWKKCICAIYAGKIGTETIQIADIKSYIAYGVDREQINDSVHVECMRNKGL